MPTLKLIPYKYEGIYKFRLPVIELRIRGEAHYFIVDTGAMETVLSVHLADVFLTPFQRKLRIARDMGGISGSVNGFAAPIQCTFIGVSISHCNFLEGNSVLDHVTPFPLSGIIGHDILRQFSSVEFDFKNEVVRFKL